MENTKRADANQEASLAFYVSFTFKILGYCTILFRFYQSTTFGKPKTMQAGQLSQVVP